ncbi:type III secretion protein HrpB2 [Burkholderia diffusa]|uniref:type III secretion protein HrpB2 n=1 Tax=Burkholderia diffusa TaxID=488732 RepID=UPI002ABDCF5D|nr:type III secretion protein HrpB2 [Burkholderia diffusa]
MSASVGSELIGTAMSGLTQGGDQAGASAGAAEKFQALMEQPHLSPPGVHAVDGQGTVVSNLVATQDAAAQQAMDDVNGLSQRAGEMDPMQMIAESSRVAMEMVQVQFDFQAKMGVVTSSRSSAETLMKNQ